MEYLFCLFSLKYGRVPPGGTSTVNSLNYPGTIIDRISPAALISNLYFGCAAPIRPLPFTLLLGAFDFKTIFRNKDKLKTCV